MKKDYSIPHISIFHMDVNTPILGSQPKEKPEDVMRLTMFDMEHFNTYAKKMPKDWKRTDYLSYAFAYKISDKLTNISIQNKEFEKYLCCDGIIKNLYLIPVSDHSTLISTTDLSYSDFLKKTENIFKAPKKYKYILKTIYNSQHQLYSNVYFTIDTATFEKKRVYLSSLVKIPYKQLTKNDTLSSFIIKKCCLYSKYALAFQEECVLYGRDNFNFFTDFALPTISIGLKVCTIAGVDWNKLLDFDTNSLNTGQNTDMMSYEYGNDNNATMQNGQISFTGSESDNNGNPCSVDGCNCNSCASGNWDPQHCNNCHHLCSKHT